MAGIKHSDILSRSVKDFFSAKFLTLSFAPFFISLAVFSVLMIVGVSEIVDVIAQAVEYDSLLYKILSFAVVHYVLSVFLYLLGSFLVIIFSVIVAVLALGFFTPTVVKTLHEQYYAAYPLKSFKTHKSILFVLGCFVKFVLIFLLCLPLIFIPFINVITLHIPFFYLFYKLLSFDVISNMFDEKNYASNIQPIRHHLVIISLVFYFLALIPIIGLFLQLFFAIYLTHYIFSFLIEQQR